MSTIPNRPCDGRRRRRLHSDEFKADVIAACMRSNLVRNEEHALAVFIWGSGAVGTAAFLAALVAIIFMK